MSAHPRELDEATCRALLEAAFVDDAAARSRALAAVAPGVRAYVVACVVRMGATAQRSGLGPDDVAQEVLLRLSRWTPDEVPEGRARAKLLAWCGVVASNFVRTTLRRAKRHDHGPARGADADEPSSPLDRAQADLEPADDRLAMHELVAELARCAAELAPPYDAVYRLALETDELTADAMALHFGQLSPDDLAQFARPDAPEALRVRVMRARGLMDKWKSRMRAQLAVRLEERFGPGALPTGLRFNGVSTEARRGRQR